MIDKIPPCSIEAEAVLLGGMIIEAGTIPPIAELLDESDFYRPGHGDLFSLLTSMAAEGLPIDLVTIRRELAKRGLMDRATGGQGYDYICQLV